MLALTPTQTIYRREPHYATSFSCLRCSSLSLAEGAAGDWGKLLGDVVVVTPLLDRLLHHGHLPKFEGKSWRLKESAARLAKGTAPA